MTPYIDPQESDDHTGGCNFAPWPGEPLCGRPATRHVVEVSSYAEGLGLLACEQHHQIARAAVLSVDGDHPVGLFCALPGSIWLPESDECVLDGSGVEPQRRAVETAVLA